MIEMTDKDGKKWMVDARYAMEKKEYSFYKGRIGIINSGDGFMQLSVAESACIEISASEAHSIMDGIEGWLNEC